MFRGGRRSERRSGAVTPPDVRPRNDFGCERCWPTAAEAAWEVRRTLAHVGELIDESHFHVMILSCSGCAQQFVSVFTESIDWKDGDDSQSWALLPLTEAEVDDLSEQRDSLGETALNRLGPGRRCLIYDHPTGEAPRVFWSTGMYVGPHD